MTERYKEDVTEDIKEDRVREDLIVMIRDT